MSTDTTPLPARDDTLLGVCQAIGEDWGFNPDWLRIALAASLLWDAKAVIAGYLIAGLVVAVVRWLVPVRRAPAVAEPAPVGVDLEDEPEPLPLAA